MIMKIYPYGPLDPAEEKMDKTQLRNFCVLVNMKLVMTMDLVMRKLALCLCIH